MADAFELSATLRPFRSATERTSPLSHSALLTVSGVATGGRSVCSGEIRRGLECPG